MSSTYDPITGLPLVNGIRDELDQIPLGSQIIPWSDLKAQGRPMRGPLYPDDAWANFALVNGQNENNPDTVQTVFTDGNHNLRVNVANTSDFPSGGSSGGGGVGPATYEDASGTGYGVRLLHDEHCFIGNNFRGARYLLGFFVMVDWEASNLATTLQAWVAVDLYDSLGTFYLALGVVSGGGTTVAPATNQLIHAQDRVYFDRPIDLTEFMADTSTARIQATNNACNCYVAGNSYFASAI